MRRWCGGSMRRWQCEREVEALLETYGKLRISDFRFPISDFRFLISDF